MTKSLFRKIVDRSIETLNASDLKGLKLIGRSSFYDCISLTSITIPSSVTRIEESSFQDCSLLNNITLPEQLTSIGIKAFSSCSALTDIKLPDSLVNIDEQAFVYCTSLTNISIPRGVSNIGKLAFSHVTGTMAIKDAYFYQPSGMEVTLPSAGSNNGMFYVKTARSMNVYTDNETIKNYAWSTDNITPTFYHLDGTAW